MSLPPPREGATALVTGASSGIGREIARALAERGHGVTVVARRRERLEELADELRSRHGVRAEVVAADLSDRAERERMIGDVAERGLDVEVLVNNAGYGIYSPFPEEGVERELDQAELLAMAVLHLNGAYLPGMLERRRGAIINVSSTSGFQPLPGNSTYAAAKAFVLFHSEALSAETRGSGVTVTAVCPGPVRTEFQESSQPLFTDRMPKAVWVTAERVARDALRAVDRGKRTVVPGGLLVRASFAPNRVTPSAIALPIASRVMSRELARGRR